MDLVLARIQLESEMARIEDEGLKVGQKLKRLGKALRRRALKRWRLQKRETLPAITESQHGDSLYRRREGGRETV